MRTRKEAGEFIKQQLSRPTSRTPWHYGRIEVKELLDFIYNEDRPFGEDEFFAEGSESKAEKWYNFGGKQEALWKPKK